MLSIVIADDHPLVLRGLAGILEAQPDLEIVATCTDGIAALKAIQERKPEIAILDIAMPHLDGLSVVRKAATNGSNTKSILLTATATDSQILVAIAHGVKGIVLKDTAADDLIDCIRCVAARRVWFPTELVGAALKRNASHLLDHSLKRLSLRERQILPLVAEGLSNKEIAQRTHLTEGTVKIYLHNIYEKLEVPNRTALAALTLADQ
jgi:two-component system, NarL family, nitrate/nitrite response regulator NarL